MQVFQILGVVVRLYTIKKFTDWRRNCEELGVDGMNVTIPGLPARSQEPASPVSHVPVEVASAWHAAVRSPVGTPSHVTLSEDPLRGPRAGVVSIERYAGRLAVL